MEHKRGVTVYWGILLAVYLAILFASTMIALTADTNNAYLIALLAAGVPIYLIASRAIMSEYEAADTSASGDENVVAFPNRHVQTAADIAQATAEARSPHLRKLG